MSKDLEDRAIAEAPIKSKTFEDRIVERLLICANEYVATAKSEITSERQLVGAIAAFLHKEEPSLEVNVEQRIDEESDRSYFVDIVISNTASSKIMIEVKTADDHEAVRNGSMRLKRYMDIAKLHTGILFLLDHKNDSYNDTMIEGADGRTIHVIAAKPKSM